MYSIFWKSLFSGLMMFFLFSNLAFAFDMVGYVNMTPIALADGDYWHNYYFGVSSFIDAFKLWFGDNSAISGFASFIGKFGKWIAKTVDMYTSFIPKSAIGTTGNILRVIVNLIIWTNSIIPMTIGLAYCIIFLLYLLFIVFQIASFIIYWFGGGFMTPLPSTDWYQYTGDWPWIDNTTSTLRAILV